MKTLLPWLALTAFLFSCSKHNEAKPAVTPPPSRDSTIRTNADGTWQSTPLSTFTYVNDLFFVSPAEGFLTGGVDSATIYHSIDSGKTWTGLPLGFSDTWLYLQFADAAHGWIQGQHSIGVTADGGRTWQRKPLPSDKALGFVFTTLQTGFYCDFYKGVYRTTDGGNSWLKLVTDTDSTNHGYYLSFPSARHGFLVRDNVGLFRTVNGGDTWTMIGNNLPTASFAFTGGIHLFNQLQFLDDYTGYYAREDGLYRTTDEGQTWKLVRRRSGWAVSVLRFFDLRRGYYSDGLQLLYTADGGETWDLRWPASTDKLISMNFSDSLHGWLGTFQGRVIRQIR